MWINTPESIDTHLGFVYIIENNSNGKWYVGQKKFWFKKTLPPLKGKKRKRRSFVESDWVKYTGSSEALNADIANGDEITKTIIHLCEAKWDMNYLEALEQFQRNALLTTESYNGIINIRLGNCPERKREEYTIITENIRNV